MTSKAPDVTAYLTEVPGERRAALEKLRELCVRSLPGYEECMEYGMPCYRRNGAVEVAFASQRQYIAVYVMKKEVVDEFRGELGASSAGKGCIRFTRPEKIDFAAIERLLRRSAESKAVPC
jgi:uncharacterized protein YdhG (YjbR/CyaY superfamily)